jgi:acetate kinase
MGVAAVTIIANPGSASRKYAVYKGSQRIATLHFEHRHGAIVCTVGQKDELREVAVSMYDLEIAASQIIQILQGENILESAEQIHAIGLRIVAPSELFLRSCTILDDAMVTQLEALERRAPLHISATLNELRILREQFPAAEIYGISDSAFHATKPDIAWNYGIPLRDADQFDVKRFGYHGISASAVVHTLRSAEKLPPKVVICHLGSGNSVTAIHHGKSIDTTMGYSPLEGVVMATRSGSIDVTAVRVLQEAMALDDSAMQDYLNKHSGLLGLSGRSSDLRELLQYETEGDHAAALALRTYVYSIQKAIGQMSAALGGLDLLAFTGTVGERSATIRERIVHNLHYLDFFTDTHTNNQAVAPTKLTCVSKLAHSKPIFVVPLDESAEMLRQLRAHM